MNKKARKGGKKKIITTQIEASDEDDFYNALKDNNELHMDFAHSISMGYHNEKYYLVFVVGGVNFLWATSRTTHLAPQDILRDFLATSGIKVGKVLVDCEFESTAFSAFCKSKGISICMATAYNHTMQAKIEGAIRICKEHV